MANIAVYGWCTVRGDEITRVEGLRTGTGENHTAQRRMEWRGFNYDWNIGGWDRGDKSTNDLLEGTARGPWPYASWWRGVTGSVVHHYVIGDQTTWRWASFLVPGETVHPKIARSTRFPDAQ